MAAMWNWLTAARCSRGWRRQSSGTLEELEGRVVFGHIDGGRVEEEVFGEAALLFGDGGEAFELFGVDDGEVEAGLGAVVEKDGVDDFAGGGREAEGDVGDAEDGLDEGDVFLDEAERLDGFDGAADVVFVAGGAGEDQGIDDDIFGRDAVFGSEQSTERWATASLRSRVKAWA
jgi:hypothetical protein